MPGCMSYPDSGGLYAQGRVRREMVRRQAAQMFEQEVRPVQVAQRLRVSTKSVYQWRRRWRAGGEAALASRGPGGAVCCLSSAQLARLRATLDRGPAAWGWNEDQRWTLARVTTLMCLRPSARSRLFYRMRIHRGRKGERRSMSEADYAGLITAAHQQLHAPVILIWDNLNAHVSAVMRAFAESHSDCLTWSGCPPTPPTSTPPMPRRPPEAGAIGVASTHVRPEDGDRRANPAGTVPDNRHRVIVDWDGTAGALTLTRRRRRKAPARRVPRGRAGPGPISGRPPARRSLSSARWCCPWAPWASPRRPPPAAPRPP